MKITYIIGLLLSCNFLVFGQNIIINEFQPSNAATIADSDGDYSDWLELYNFSDSTINLQGWFLSDDVTNPFKWQFPAVLIPSEGYLIVFASDKDTVYANGEVHTNFKIGNGTEGVYIHRADSSRSDSTPVVLVQTDWSYGRYPDVAPDWFFFDQPTPGLGNSSQPIGSFAQSPVFSHTPGYYASSFMLVISPAVPGDTIYYTLDGSTPTLASAIYSQPLLMQNMSNVPNRLSTIQTTLPGVGFSSWKLPNGNVYKFNTVRARVFKTGSYPSKTTSASYIVDPQMTNRYKYPLVSIMTDSVNLFDDTIGIYVAGVGIDSTDWLTAHFAQEGDAWERPIHLEIFDPTGSMVVSQDAGVRIGGNYTCTTNIKSLRLYARSEYGDSSFNYQFFNDQALTDFKRLRLRNTGNDAQNAYMRDVLVNEAIKHHFPSITRWRPSVVFIDGEYWGIHNIRERHDKYYFFSHFGIDYDDLDFLELNSQVIEGTNVHYVSMLNFVTTNNMADSANYAYLCTQMDPENYIDYLVNAVYTGQTDWPVHNTRYWRKRTTSYQPDAVYGNDGRWRWLLVDQDFGLGRNSTMAENYDHLNRLLNVLTGWQNSLTVKLLGNKSYPGNQTFRHQFINTFADRMNTTYMPDRMLSIFQMLYDTLYPQMPEHINRWRYPASMYHWQQTYCSKIISYLLARPTYMKQFIVNDFSLQGTCNITLDVNDSTMGRVRINTITIDSTTLGLANSSVPYPWSGTYFRGVPVTLVAIPNQGYTFSHWEGYSGAGNDTIIINPPDTNISLTAHFIPSFIPQPELVHFWLFDNAIPNDLPLDSLNATYSLLTGAKLKFHSALNGYPFDPTSPNWGKASMQRRNAPTPVNYRPEANNNLPYGGFTMRAIQIKQPFTGDGGENTMYFEAPTTGYEDIKFSFAAKNELAADAIVVDYTTANPPVWTTFGLASDTLPLTSDFQLFEIDFTEIPAVDENPDFQVRMRFYGQDMTADLGNRVTFNNVSIDGISTFIPSDYYSKSEGDLTILTSWGANADGSGMLPTSFSDTNMVFHIQNRTVATLESNWSVTGNGSRVVVGNGTDTTVLILNAALNGTVDVTSSSTLKLTVSTYPVLGNIAAGSTVWFSGAAQNIPYGLYHHIRFTNINPVFSGPGTITIQGNADLEGTVSMPDARGASLYSLLFSGSANQLITTHSNVLRSYNMTFLKTAGSIHFGSGSTISTDNQFAATIGINSAFADDGITIYAGNSVNIAGNGASYNLTGTLILAGTEAGIVKGSGAANNFNIRDEDAFNKNAVAAFNNIVVRVANTGGEFRFRDGTTNTFTIKGNLIVESGAAGRIRFYTNNNVFIGGNLIIQSGYAGTIDLIKSINFNGNTIQNVTVPSTLNLSQLIISNGAGQVFLDGVLDVTQSLTFNNGILKTAETGLVKMGLTGQITGFDVSKYVEGSLGLRANNVVSKILNYPLGINGGYMPFTFEVAHTGSTEVLYVGRISQSSGNIGQSDDLEYLVDNNRFILEKTGTNSLSAGKITLPFNASTLGFDPQWLRVAQQITSVWINLGGLISGSKISSVENITEPSAFALAKALDPSVIPDTLVIQNISIAPFTDTCFAAIKQITVAGNGTNFSISANGSVNLVAGERILIFPQTNVANGGYLHAWLDEGGNYCSTLPTLPAAAINRNRNKSDLVAASATDNPAFFRIFPNPTNGRFTIEFDSGNNQQPSHAEIYGMMGERLFSRKLSEEKSHEFDISNLPAGIYLIRVVNGTSGGFGKIILR